MSSLAKAPKPDGGTSADGAGEPATAAPGRQAGWVGLSAALDRKRWVWPVLVLLGYLAQLALRLLLTRTYDFPVVNADEPSYLVLARVLGGGTVTDVPVGSMVPG